MFYSENVSINKKFTHGRSTNFESQYAHLTKQGKYIIISKIRNLLLFLTSFHAQNTNPKKINFFFPLKANIHTHTHKIKRKKNHKKKKEMDSFKNTTKNFLPPLNLFH